jgi:all-trans-retinol dehydrogenase (NAD+)
MSAFFFLRTFGVNTLGLLWTAKTFLPSMIENNHGHFLIVASQTAFTSTPGLTDYSASKSAAVAIYEGIDGEVRNIHKAHSVRVSCINPSLVGTKMFNGVKLGRGVSAIRPEAMGEEISGIIMAGRSRNVTIPRSAGLSVWSRVLPDWTRVAMQSFTTGIFTDLKPHDPLQG